MNLKYQSLLKDNGLTEQDLSSEAVSIIKQIANSLTGIRLTEKRGKTVRQSTLENIISLDKMLCREINETIKNKQSGGAGSNQKPADDTDEAEKAKKAEAEAKKAEQEKAKKEAQEAEEKKKKEAEEKKQAENAKSDPLGFEIDKELEKAIKDGKTVVKLSELRSIAPNTYEAIFSGYEAGKENGVQTTFYSCIETETETFTIKKL